MIEQVRGVVTSLGADGRSVLMADHTPLRQAFPSGVSAVEVWHTDALLSDPLAGYAPTTYQLAPQPGGTLFRLFEIPPGAEVRMHQTATIDYIVVITGELVLVLGG